MKNHFQKTYLELIIYLFEFIIFLMLLERFCVLCINFLLLLLLHYFIIYIIIIIHLFTSIFFLFSSLTGQIKHELRKFFHH